MAILLFSIPFRLHQFADSHTESIHQKLSMGQNQAYVSYHGSMDRFENSLWRNYALWGNYALWRNNSVRW